MSTAQPPGEAYIRETHRAMIIARIAFMVVLAAGVIVSAILFASAIPSAGKAVGQSATVTAASRSVDAAEARLARATSDLKEVKEAGARVDPSDATDKANFYDTISIDTVAQKKAARDLEAAQENLLKARGLDSAQSTVVKAQLTSAYWALAVSAVAIIVAGAFLLALTLAAGRAVAMVELARRP